MFKIDKKTKHIVHWLNIATHPSRTKASADSMSIPIKLLKGRQTIGTDFHCTKKGHFSAFLDSTTWFSLWKWFQLWSVVGRFWKPSFVQYFWHQDWGEPNKKLLLLDFYTGVKPQCAQVGGESHNLNVVALLKHKW